MLTDLPYVDEHSTVITARADDVWAALLETLDRAFARPGASIYARAVGCADGRASGPRPLTEGSSIPGFRIARALPPSELVLTGRHRFSTYALIFRIEQLDTKRSRLNAETRAAFPRVAGSVYRMLVIGTGGHVIAVRRLLARVQRATERVRS
jgi:hypothetical protein